MPTPDLFQAVKAYALDSLVDIQHLNRPAELCNRRTASCLSPQPGTDVLGRTAPDMRLGTCARSPRWIGRYDSVYLMYLWREKSG